MKSSEHKEVNQYSNRIGNTLISPDKESSNRSDKWKDVIKFFKKNPEILVKVIPDPKDPQIKKPSQERIHH
jgi:hypothetical protein